MKKIKQLLFSALILSVVAYSGCMRIYGIHDQKKLSEAEILARSKEAGIANPRIIDNDYKSTLSATFPNHPQLKKDLQQPLQFWLITDSAVICNMVNCHAGGFPNLKWNLGNVYRSSIVNTEIPDTVKATYAIQQAFGISAKEGDTTAIIAYSLFMGRQNKRFLKKVKEFLSQHSAINAVYVNMDNSFTDN